MDNKYTEKMRLRMNKANRESSPWKPMHTYDFTESLPVLLYGVGRGVEIGAVTIVDGQFVAETGFETFTPKYWMNIPDLPKEV